MIINKDLSLNTRFFKIANTTYEIIGTESKINAKIYDVVDKVRNNNTGEVKEMRRAKLNIMLNKYNAKEL